MFVLGRIAIADLRRAIVDHRADRVHGGLVVDGGCPPPRLKIADHVGPWPLTETLADLIAPARVRGR
jgi:hypothetical protein